MTLAAGTHLGRYEVRSKIGEGGMGEVYLAQDTQLRRSVALKILPAEFTLSEERLRRFEREAYAASALNHPNIITIHEIGKTDSTHYIVTEFIDGESLRQLMQNGPVSVGKVLDVAVQITNALATAHAAGIIHRDIKPENVMLRPDGVAKVLDFGLAKLTQNETGVDSEALTRALVNTSAGIVMGTASYMSPEQARGTDTDARTDIFSLGVVLYEMLAGRVPFAGETTADIISVLLKKEPQPLSTLAPDTPAELQHIVSKALRKDRDERYQTAKSLLIDLKTLQQELDFAAKLERGPAPDSKDAVARNSAQAASAHAAMENAQTQTAAARPTSSAEYVVSRIKQHRRGFAAALAVLLLVATGFGYWLYNHRASKAVQIESIAVLPFVNGSGNADVEYLSDGITESLITSLSQLPNLSVKARSSVFRYKGKDVSPGQIGKELNVQAVLNGRVAQRGNDLTMHIELVDVKTETALWSGDYSRSMTNLVSLQSEIAFDVSNKLQLKLTSADERQLAKHPTDNVEAYQLYLKGQYEWNKHTQEDLQKAIEYNNQALEKDPNYGLAYRGLSISYIALGNSYLPPNEAFPKAKAYAAKALAIDETLAEAHEAMGAVRLMYDWNWAEAERELKRAQALNPNDADAHHLYGYYLNAMGRLDEAKAEMGRAQELDPLAPMTNSDVGVDFYYARKFDDAIGQNERTIILEPHFFIAYLWLGQAYEQKKMYAKAIETFQKGMNLAERHPQLVAALGRAYALSGERDKANQSLAELGEMSKRRYVSPYLFAVVYAGLGDQNQAFAWLDKAFQDRSFFLIWLKVEPLFDPLRADPRFADLVHRVGLPS